MTPDQEQETKAALERTLPVALRVIAARRDGREAWISDQNNLDLMSVVTAGTRREQYALIMWLAHLAVVASAPDHLAEVLAVYGKGL
jgi:hypothetical protein